jgi:hypothetical protein
MILTMLFFFAYRSLMVYYHILIVIINVLMISLHNPLSLIIHFNHKNKTSLLIILNVNIPSSQ